MGLRTFLGLGGPKIAQQVRARSPLPKSAWRPWFNGKELTSIQVKEHIPIWSRVFGPLRHQSVSILEIGSWEGSSAIFFLEFLPHSTMVCIDTFTGNTEYRPDDLEYAACCRQAEARFDNNLAAYAQRVQKVKAKSPIALAQLNETRRSFDVIYIDGSHHCDDVLVDSLLAWSLLKKPGGILIWDDYQWTVLPADRPGPAIDVFLRLHAGQFVELVRGRQIIIERAP